MSASTDHISSQVNFIQLDVGRSSNVEDNSFCTIDGRFEQWGGDCCFCCDLCFVFAACTTNAHVSRASTTHNLANVLEVEVDESRSVNQVGDTLYTVFENIICFYKCIEQSDLGLRSQTQTFILNNNQSVNIFFECCNTAFCLFHSLFTLKFEWFGYNTNRQNIHFFCDLCNNRSSTGSGSAAHTGSDEDHLTAFDCSSNFFAAFFRSFLASLRNASCSTTSGQTVANYDLLTCFGIFQCLCIGVNGDEVHTLHSAFDHAVNSVTAAAADTNDFYSHFYAIIIVVEFKIRHHLSSFLLYFISSIQDASYHQNSSYTFIFGLKFYQEQST